MGLGALACGGVSAGRGEGGGAGGFGQSGGSASAGAGTAAGGGGGAVTSEGHTKLRLLTQSEYRSALSDLLGTISTPLTLPEDVTVAGFVAVGAAKVAVNASGVALYEEASRAATAEVFSDAARWQKLVGCRPPADLSDDCLVDFVKKAGKRAYRRELTEVEVQRWVRVGRDAAELPGSSAEQGLAAVTSGLLQSFNFLYRVETNELDASSGRLKYDGGSMATRLSFLLSGRPPSDALLAAAEAGELDTAEGVRAAAAPLLEDPSAVDQMVGFFNELSEVALVSVVVKDPSQFPTFGAALQSSMLQATQLFIKNIVLAPGADVRSLYDSDRTFVDGALAPLYGVSPPASGFLQIALGPESGRAGILGQAGVIAAHSQPDYNSPTRRGLFILERLLCETPPTPPDGVVTTLPIDEAGLTKRQRLERLVASSPCTECHAVFDPLGFALEHFDSIGQYRATEDGLAIDATGALDGVAFDGLVELAATLRQSPRTTSCLIKNFYRAATARTDVEADSAQIEALQQSLTSHDYVWRDLVGELVASDAFRSAPATTADNQ